MKIFLPLVTWIVLLSSTAYSQQLSYKTKNSRFRGEVFFLNLEDGYFGCQVNESTDYLQLYELSKLCDGKQDCFLGSDELSKELKCTNDCDKDGTQCTNGVCLNGVCHCNDGYGGCNCNVQDENECKYRPCDVFSHCTNTLGSFTCTCFPGYRGDGLHCEDIDECQDPSIAARCVENADCCNLPAHFLCKCKDGYEGDGEVLCTDIDECRNPNACGKNARCINTPGNFTCECPEGFLGNPFDGCVDVDECSYPKTCGPRSICTNLEGSYRCDCPPGYEGDGRSETGCVDDDECARLPCGRNAQCLNTDGSYKCSCPDGYKGDPATGCEAACILDTECGTTEICQGGQCLNPCDQPQACGMNAECQMGVHLKQCLCPAGFTGNPDVECVRIPVACTNDQECGPNYTCRDSMCLPSCVADQDCALNEKCLKGNCMLTCRVDNDCFLGHVCLHNKCVFGCHVDDDCSASESCRNDKCINPCQENPCGPNAACTVSNHRASCTCLEGMVPNPTPKVGCVRTPAVGCTENRDCAVGLSCFESLCRPFCADDSGCLANERCTNGVCKPLCRRDDDCRNSEVCLGQMCVAGCRSDQGCPDNLACVGQQCANPCDNPTACGTNAECSVENHKKLCTCPNELVGNADIACKAQENTCSTKENCPPSHLCYGGVCQRQCRNDQNCLSDERCMRGTCRNVCNTDSACSLGQICENRVCQIGCRNDLTCPSDQSCVNKKCKNPCEMGGQCGHCATCLVVNHGVQCSCPNGFTGDGLTGCLMPPQRCNPGCECDESNTYCAPKCIRNDDCPCGQMCSRGRCGQKCGPGKPCPLGQLCERGSCLSGCKVNTDCTTDQVCTKNQCVNPCTKPGACGENALCTVSDHHVLCYCPDGYEGEPSKKCLQFECHADADCESNKRCDDGKCRNPCLEYGACGINAQCRVVNRRPQCSCPPDFFGNPETECQSLTGVGCATNPCGENSKCRDVPGGFECSCMDGCMGDATKGCVCGETQVNVCHDQPCGLNAACRVADHNEPQCYCPEDYPNGDAYVQCYLTPPKEDCRTNGCNVGECVRQGYDYICKQDTEQCQSDKDCPSEKACLQGHCNDPCAMRGVCGANALCKTVLHRPRCSCPNCFIGRPEVECKPDPKCADVTTTTPRDPTVQMACSNDQDCPENLQCSSYGQCSDPCQSPSFSCEGHKKCETRRHRPVCVCKSGFIVNEYGELTCAPEKRECYRDDDCASNMACTEGKCRNPCIVPVGRQAVCSENKSCQVQDHKPVCICMKDCQPSISICLRDTGCPTGLACRKYQCVNPCDFAQCAANSPCIVEDHKPICKFCPPGFIADARNGCQKEIGCTSSNECPSQRACVNSLCVDPCSYANPCAKDQECQVKQHHPVCVKVCECQRNSDCRGDALCDGCHCLQPRESGCEHCPYGTTCDPTTGACIKVECTRNEDCGITEACIGEKCQHPCDVHNPCAFNAICINTNHGSDCSCEDGYQGNGFVGCQPAAQDHGSVCQYNEDCPPDKLCDRLNRRCVNPCMEDSCGENAECIPANHGIECHCFSGFVGNAYVQCQRVQGCRSDSECDSNEACVNGKCSSPCRCGLNALCDVVNHQGVCKCPPGYGGSPEISCDPPTNPCEPNPCGVNAMCELDRGNPICFCPKGLTGNPFKNCIPEGDECSPNPCGPNSGCRVVSNSPICFCLPEYEGQPPSVPCELPTNPCDPSPCGPNTQCTILSNGFSKCTCLPNYVESPNTIRGCVAPINPCDPNPCGQNAVCDSGRDPVCFCPDNKVGNPFKLCQEPTVNVELCRPGPCGKNADCYIVGNREQCYCSTGFIGDPYGGCREPPRSACEPNPCGPNAICSTQGLISPVCSCPQGLVGDPTSPEGCQRYECQVDSDCASDKACMGFKCYDPCPGACGVEANCRVEEHHPVCTCNPGLTGNPGILCFAMDTPKTTSKNPCQPSPCGLNTECKVMNNRAVCSCMPEYLGDPQSGCRPECVINSDCGPTNACINRKCVDPCAASVCGINALCKVIQHTPTCACIENYVGDSFLQCTPVFKNVTRDPCNPSPCGPNDVCSVYGDGIALCNPCFGPDAIYNPRCRPECLSNSDCPFDKACMNQNCLDPCPGSCGHNAVCNVYEHRPVCSCPQGLFGNPYEHCSAPSPLHPTKEETCNTFRCGANADCKRGKGGLACVCRKGYFGDALVGCRPECVLNSDCSSDKSCVNTRCVDSCVGVCGLHANCHVVNHAPVCICREGYAGDAFTACQPFYLPPADKKTPGNPCEPSPCGPNSRCFSTPEGYAACSCLPGYKGAPPVCQSECVVSSECPLNKACINQKCTDPCPGTCGIGARCEVLNHNPVCGCEPGFEGDPFVSCSRIPGPTEVGPTKRPTNPCLPSPCGPNSICQVKQGRPVCSCVANYIGSPPYCRPECALNSECPLDKACIQEKCRNPCENTCGLNARCTVISHSAHCSCDEGYEGDAFVGCSPTPEKPRDRVDPCYPNPCGENAVCSDRNGAHRCSCIDPYIGDPYTSGCRPECVYNSECSSGLACIKQHCRDPCVGNCGTNAECTVANHVPTCSCQRGYEGDPFTGCKREPTHIGPKSPCEPSPCGPNSLCRVIDGRPTCSCQVGYFGSPPTCRPECVVSAECNQNLACINQKCVDPCAGTCGFNAKCQVVNHNPICSCPTDFIGDPFEQCVPKPLEPTPKVNPCIPSPCGPNAECREMESRAVCTCSTGMFGAPPNCRPECVIHQDCPSNRACIRQRCEDPCIGACGFNAICSSQNHKPICSCIEGHEGDPYAGCNMRTVVPDFVDPCHPSPCGSNAICKERNGAGSCTCMQNYFGDPYLNCRPECVQNSDCPRTKSCVNMKCVDPCVDLCGINSECRISNHLPVCSCAPGYTGNPLRICHLIPEIKAIEPVRNPCRPSPCGLYSTCQVNSNRPVCSCLPDYIGSPPNCRPECVISSECASDKACVNQRCRDPCPGTCGNNARCRVTNHSPICTCARGYTGDPFTLCVAERIPPIAREPSKPTNPCVPSPCGSNSQCRVANTGAVCSCVANYVGRPPNCRPECTINSECPSHLACMNTRCSDPCIGSCGSNAICYVRSHAPICMCNEGYTGDPFSGCFREVPQLPEPIMPCNPSPCGLNSICQERDRAASCKCIPEYFGDPYVECRPECVINTDCVKSKACVNNKCIDPCPGMCGYNAECGVVNHSPHCDCLPGYTGNPISGCHLIPQDPIIPIVQMNPCQPSPCGLYSNCRAVNGHAVCSCIASYIGAPPNCRPECMSSSECAQDRSCINQRCKDPCPGTCGLNAKCRTVNHNPICTCMPGFTGDPFLRCIYEEKKIITYAKDANPCVPSPCGPNSQCRVVGQNEHAICSCLPNYIGRAPNCRPECTSNSECPGNRACINQRCQDPCVGSCGSFTTCTVNKHRPVCRCIDHYSGDPFSGCSLIIEIPPEKAEPCNPSPCGANAICKERNGAGSCTCLPDYSGDPYSECRPECVLNSDCAKNRACVNNKCRDPCPGVCGVAAECHVINHAPSCSCPSGFTGNPSEYCREIQIQKTPIQPCRPSPCGPYSNCREVNGHAVCSCLQNHIGSPPACRPECSVSSECSQDKACLNLRCVDPCPGTCGQQALCKVTNHNPICSCPPSFAGDPFIRCIKEEHEPTPAVRQGNPCVPSPCGPNSQCREVRESPVCSCLPNFIGRAPNCRPECTINSECPANLACVNLRCKDPCPGSCGFNAYCNVVNHSPVCSCKSGFTGDPFSGCNPTPLEIPNENISPCNPSPCGPNAQCKERNGAGSCTCLDEYFGDPYSGCRPECVANSDCPRDKSCNNNKCIDPCPGVCGRNAECHVVNHSPNCDCLPGFTGNALSACHEIQQTPPEPKRAENPCSPSPCGPYSQCRETNGHAVCSCLNNFIGSPPNCRPECVVSSECPQDRSCENQKCVDPCPGTCGPEARCQVINHYAACSCPPGYTGDPFNRCEKIIFKPEIPTGNPCVPSPCGPNSKCIEVGDSPACSCLSNYIGRPPNCRPECISSSECPANLACINQKCSDPCAGACGIHTLCNVIKHNAQCQCESGYTGDPFSGCSFIERIQPTDEPRNPCNPSPCGANAVCRERSGVGSCTCLPEYFGDPYSGCRPECVQNSDCDRTKACINNKCQDPCPGVCGLNAECRVLNHAPSCLCIEGFTGDAHRICNIIETVKDVPTNPCQPSPCGSYSQCHEINGHAVCSCNEGYIGAPPNCKPECVVSSECSQNRACINTKCSDPCPGTCGSSARCQVVNHNPICTCPPGLSGDPFVSCIEQVEVARENPCVPSPCGPNSLCREIGDQAACSCQANYVGRPPNCRPECTNNDECQNNLACQNERCLDPCPGSCGNNAVCKVVQHNPVCTCSDGFEGDALLGCTQIIRAIPTEPPSSPCEPSPCGPHAECRERNGAGACYCHEGFEGNAYDTDRGCRRECETNEDCQLMQACVRFKCVDPCDNICGDRAICGVENHVPTCTCPPGLTGDPFFQCKEIPMVVTVQNPCVPSPCGPNSICRNINNQAVCSCQSGFIDQPPNCKPECVVSSECSPERACVNNKCVDPCPHTCGIGALCTTKNHSPICTCPRGQTGDPFVQCIKMPIVIESEPTERPPSCVPSPCGPNSKCQVVGGSPACSCLPDFIGSPPSCRPECVLNSECGPTEACINQKCRDPCPGSCGFEARCHVLNHVPICNCIDGYTGDPFVRCNILPPSTMKPLFADPCNPSPCGSNADCFSGECRCQDNYQGNPYDGCRPECTLSADCSRDKACLRNKCVDPCPGTCGINARCEVIAHIPVCSCVDGYEGDPFTSCRQKPPVETTRTLPCSPSPCGANSQCRDINDHAVCSCLDGFIGAPPQCRPECVINSECSATQACVNKKCVDPCRGSCGIDARCEVINHSPICGCPPGKTGDPFKRCTDIPVTPIEKTTDTPRDPCVPSPCGPNSICRSGSSGPSCQCLPEFFGSPPNCRPECIINPDCSSTQACINNKCRDPCPGSCGTNAECRVISHTVSCSCPLGFGGNAFVQCIQQDVEEIKPCEPSPCGANAECIERNGAASCKCIDEYQGDPYEGCRPECVLSSDCPTDKACIRNKCKDPCPGVCGQNAECYSVNHLPNCVCITGYSGDPFTSCHREVAPTVPTISNPCSPSPCGPNSKCREANGVAVCSCLDAYIGAPPNCKPECTVNAECPQNKACHKFKCANPCAGTCGIDAKCEVINHNPICSCPLDMTGDPFTRCHPTPISKVDTIPPRPVNPCVPNPCGLYSECRSNGETPSCSCLPAYIGSPPNCRPECIVNTDCASDMACIAEKCRNPCEGSCGINSECRIQNHIPICTCRPQFTGDPFSQCVEIIEEPIPTSPTDPCDLQPCGANADCDAGVCTCHPDYFGDPYVGCRPECTLSTDCSPNKACINRHCIDPCPGTCGEQAQCDVSNHIPICSCPKDYTGDPFIHCRPEVKEIRPTDPCNPSPCGPNSVCHSSVSGAVCACQPGMLGSPPACKPECLTSSECSLQTACLQKRCVDPCPGACGQYAKCQVINHNPVCSCNAGFTGDPFTRCFERPIEKTPIDPCQPTPCGPNSDCKVINDSPACSCLETFIGTPPNCRPECTINPECPSTKACIRQKCDDPCPGSCGYNARCSIANHMPICSCENGFTGDPFTGCQPIQEPPPTPKEPRNPCYPSPCGINSECQVRGDSYTCECVNDYIGNPYEGCRPECVGNSECSANRACIRYHCADPCPGTCGIEAICTIHNHIPVCSCPTGMTGDAFRQCTPVVRKEQPPKAEDPCYPSPCGTNSVCRNVRGNAVCECLPGYFGNPIGQGCRPECTLSSDCAKNLACVNSKCVDPCPGVCGYAAQCQVVNHNPICSCPSLMVGNPFVECHTPTVKEPVDPCNPSPCRSNGNCRVINGAATCTYPECVTNEECQRDRACVNQKCRDPCINACGLNAICSVINHKALCTCPTGYYGSPYNQCTPQMDVVIVPQPECTSDNDCSNDKACINQECKNPCEQANICGQNAKCHVQLHRPLCVCNEGYTGNAQTYCHAVGCRVDDECPANEACINKQCIDPCLYTQCGTLATCRADYNHKARCYCPEGYRGNPQVQCVRPECTRDSDCAFNLACLNERCEDPCNCGAGAQCRVDNHRALCRCPPGYSGDPTQQCTIVIQKETPQCTVDADCPSKFACFSSECKNPCVVTKPCGTNAICSVVDTLPLRTMMCQCEPGYIGDADVGCRKEPQKDQGCRSHEDCTDTEACRNGDCMNPCLDGSPCARTAECIAQRHRAVCTCPSGLLGDPFVNCYEEPKTIVAGCTHDSDCAPSTACINRRCQDPCAEGNPCGGNAECRVSNFRPLCFCPAGWVGDPQVQCYKPECKTNSECPYDKACINENCVNPCTFGSVRCGTGAQCQPQNHQAVCVCPAGTQGNPFVSCITGHCQYNEDCADHEACDRLNRVCRPVCDEDTCAANAICTGRRHQPRCECRQGTTGNPFVECVGFKEPPIPKPECEVDSDCPTQLACMNNRCANPCAVPNVCTPQQICTVLDTLPLRTMICKCPSDMVTDNSRNCVPIKHDVSGCQFNEECANSEVCQQGQCIEACRLDRCGLNAQCKSRDHYAQCTCPIGYEGNPRVECNAIAGKTPTRIPSAECYSNEDCTSDQNCRNERCINPCSEDPCGRGAYCHVEIRIPICRCPTGYNGDARVACIPPTEVSTIGCKSNSDCSSSESCVNEQCINPCNCGNNAECVVRNHHPVCYCKAGFSGNAQYGCVQIGCSSDDECSMDKQCMSRECVNPCLLADPCALNAECFGRNHRATCRCPQGLEGDPFTRCLRVECRSDYDCLSNQACLANQCVNPCLDSPCAQNAICNAINHAAVCRCPEATPLGNPFSYCERRAVEPQCVNDPDCPSRMACIDNKCKNPCIELSPCASSARCSVLDSVPVRTMVCVCPESHVPDARGECKPIILQTPPGCTSDSECSDNEACVNRQCRNPCNCGTNAICNVQNHRAICSCQDGFDGNPYATCRSIGCRVNGECDSGKACINGNCVSPCLVNDPCGINAECYVQGNEPLCRCNSGYRGNAYERCRVIGCRTNSDCPSDKTCINEQCVDPCIYENPCSSRAECRPQNHFAICRCPSGFMGNPYIDCQPDISPECTFDTDCPSRLACINNECQDPCSVLEPCNRPARCEVTPTSPVRTMICICPDGYISSGSGTCKPTKAVVTLTGGCISDPDCPVDKSCISGVCRDPCRCGLNAECRIKNHKPVCTCRQGFEGNPEFECSKVECVSDSACPSTHSCINGLCIPACQDKQCGKNSDCLALNHRAICECAPGFGGNARVACVPVGCRTDSECPSDKACVNQKCQNPCDTTAVCAIDEVCKVYQHRPQCACPPGTISRKNGCVIERSDLCVYDSECPTQTACIGGECVNPCNATTPCGVNANCRVLDTVPVRTMICECLEGYTGNAAVQCDKRSLCVIEKGFVRDITGQCICPPGTALDIYEYCTPCVIENGFKIDETGHCMCALERGMVVDERGRCICPFEYGYRLTKNGECVPTVQVECQTDEECADNRYCNPETKTCEDACLTKTCGINAFCNTINHKAICQCNIGYTGNADEFCNHTNFRTDFPRPEMIVSCLADGVQVQIHLPEPGFNGVLYVKGHSKDEDCRRVVNLSGESAPRNEIFKVHFGSCGLMHVNGIASFVLVIQKHPKLVTYKAQAYNIKCVYQTGEKNVTLGFNVSMLTTAGTIANTGPPPICQMRIITHNGQEINSAEIGDNLMLQVDVEPSTIYGGFARSCIAKTMEDNVENEYIVTDENGCATDPTIFGEWEYNPDTNSLLASFNAFKFPSSDNIRFQCNIRVCFGKCQPVNCRGYNAFGRRRRRAIADNSTSSTAVSSVNGGMEGTLREEITIQSNAILTFEKREGGSSDSSIKPAAQRVEDICVSMVGLIIALVITALLALVAVAVAVSCWLMAYRRRPKTVGPLPHPPEFPNPLFSNPEAIPEPTPDYLS